jgi:hypothetical protein
LREIKSSFYKQLVFWVGLEPGLEDDLEIFDLIVSAEYESDTDDPAYDPHSGNSITMSWHPVTHVDLRGIEISFKQLRDDLELRLDKHELTGKKVTLAFSYEAYDPWVKLDGGWVDTRFTVEVDTSRLMDLDYVNTLTVDIEDGIYNYLDPFTDGIVDTLQ